MPQPAARGGLAARPDCPLAACPRPGVLRPCSRPSDALPPRLPHAQETVLTKAYAVGANLSGADLTNAVVDRVDFTKANLSGAKLVNAVVTGATFEGANGPAGRWVEGAQGRGHMHALPWCSHRCASSARMPCVHPALPVTRGQRSVYVLIGQRWLFAASSHLPLPPPGADLTGAIFEDALIGSQDAKGLCANPTLQGESRDQVGCRQ